MNPKKDNKDDHNKDNDLPLLLPEKIPDDSQQTSVAKPRTSETTVSVAESFDRIRRNVGVVGQELSSSISLHILGVEVPLKFDNQTEVLLGRVSPGAEEQPDIDLSLLPVNAVGVSRKHVRFLFRDDVWFVEDLGSRNGTWLNNTLMTAYQRYKLKDGDQVRVGNVIIIVVVTVALPPKPPSFDASAPQFSNIITLNARSILDNQRGLSPKFLATHLLPYLNTVVEMMQHVDKAKKRSQREFSIVSIEFEYPAITVKFASANEIIEFLRNDFRKLSASGLDADGVTQVLDMENNVVSDEHVTAIAQQFLANYFPLISSDQASRYQNILVPLFRQCITSIIRIAR